MHLCSLCVRPIAVNVHPVLTLFNVYTSAMSAVLPTYDVSMRPPRFDGSAMRVLSWNVASLRSMLTKVMHHWVSGWKGHCIC